ncbi:hypothetical protein EVG20_g9350 [Dentipellis fragilis]|uniref:Uncharacterized protein n=1 Tax=Dentipellis fragilis TaxID=205917 RepID=A0A4Y9Y1A2_9AGAM|nr:hypothetical protein EVG20_g9350 [Dentipellis fragilis]
MNRLKSLAAILLGPAEDDVDESAAALEAAGVPVSFADCRNCPHPCEEPARPRGLPGEDHLDDRHDVGDAGLRQAVPQTGPSEWLARQPAGYLIMLGVLQVVISTGRSDWARSITDEKGSLAAHLLTIETEAPNVPTPIISPDITAPGTPESGLKELPEKPPLTPISGIFKASAASTVSILNGSHNTVSSDYETESVLVFPDYKVVTEVSVSLEGAKELWENSVNPAVPRLGSLSTTTRVKSWIIPYSCVILICKPTPILRLSDNSLPYLIHAATVFGQVPIDGETFGARWRRQSWNEVRVPIQSGYGTIWHVARDLPDALMPPPRLPAFSETLEREGWEVHTHLDEPTGPPLEEFNDSEDAKEAEMQRRLQELDDDLPKRALILKTSHIGGHKYAGNIIIYMPQGAGVWYGRVSTHEVEPIVRTTILDGRILPPLLRGGVNLSRPDCKRLNDW